jgi:hypothetical protein
MSYTKRYLLQALIVGLFASLIGGGLPTLYAQTEDVTPPHLVNFSFSPTSVDVANGAQTVTVTVRITDELSGFGSGSVSFVSPSGGQYRGTSIQASNLVDGNIHDGTYRADIVFPQFSEAGTWRVYAFYMWDRVGNQTYLYDPDIAALGLQDELSVVGGPDLMPPRMDGFVLSPSTINVSGASQTVTVTVHVTDEGSGLGSGSVSFVSPSGGQYRGTSIQASNLVDGNIHDGTYQAEVVFPQFSEAGTWGVYAFYMWDCVGNQTYLYGTDIAALGFPTSLEVDSQPEDTTPPQLEGFAFSPSTIDVSGGAQTVTVTVHVTDDLSGFGSGSVSFVSPLGGQYRGASIQVSNLVGGNVHDGTYQADVVFPQFSKAGTWQVYAFYMWDSVGNQTYLYGPDIANLGFPTSLEMTVNQLPAADAGPDKNLIVKELAEFDGSGSSDADGSIASYQWDFGDGATGVGWSASHAYLQAGTYTVTLTVIDDGGGTATDTAQVGVHEVAYAIDSLSELVASYNLKQGIANSLDSKLQNVLDALSAANAGQRQDVTNKLDAFVNSVEAQRAKELTNAQADALESLARRIVAVL